MIMKIWEKGWTSPTGRLSSLSPPVPDETQQSFGILALHEASGDRKAKTPFERLEKLPPIG